MDRKIGGYIAAGLVSGSALGLMWGSMIGNAALGIAIGALAGLFIGWFAAAATRKSGKNSSHSTGPGNAGEKSDR